MIYFQHIFYIKSILLIHSIKFLIGSYIMECPNTKIISYMVVRVEDHGFYKVVIGTKNE